MYTVPTMTPLSSRYRYGWPGINSYRPHRFLGATGLRTLTSLSGGFIRGALPNYR